MTQDSSWWGWIAALALSLLGLGLTFWKLERPGLRPGKSGLTLTRTLQRWMGIRPRDRGRKLWAVPAFIVVVGGAMVGLFELILHILNLA